MSDRVRRTDWRDRIAAVRDVRDLLRLLRLTRRAAVRGGLSPAIVAEVHADAFRLLQRLTEGDPARGQRLIQQLVVPFCAAVIGPSDSGDARVGLTECRTALAEWIDAYPDRSRARLMSRVMRTLKEQLEQSPNAATCWTVSRIGLRRSDVVRALWAVADDAGDTKDAALATLAGLGLRPRQRARVRDAVHARADRRTIALVSALYHLADPGSIPVVVSSWLRDREGGSRMDASLAVSVLAAIAEASDRPNVHALVWASLSQLVEGSNQETRGAVYLGRHVGPSCDTPNVVRRMLTWLTLGGWDSDSSYPRYLLYERLSECVLRRQLEGWARGTTHELVSALRADACRDTRAPGDWTTTEMRVKRHAWETALRLGHSDALTWFDEAVPTESSGYVRHSLMEMLAVFRFDPLPSGVAAWITEPQDTPRERASADWIARLGATRLARSAATREAFDALARPGTTIGGELLHGSAEALTDVALALANRGDPSVVAVLLDKASAPGVDPRERQVAAAPLEALAAAGHVAPEAIERLAEAASDEHRGTYERSLFVAAIGRLPSALSRTVVSRLLEWTESGGWLGPRAMEALARHGELTDRPELVERWIDPPMGDGGETNAPKEGSPHVLGALYRRNPERFAPPMAAFISRYDNIVLAPLLHWLDRTHDQPEAPPLPQAVQTALVDRVRRRQTNWYGETELFRALGRLAPAELARAEWRDAWSGWLPDVRAALADALGEARPLTPSEEEEAGATLSALARDPSFAVRRAAHRALARRQADRLVETIGGWSGSAVAELRRLAGEASVWLPRDDLHRALYRRLTADRELRVREAAARARKDRRRRLEAERYADLVLGVRGESNRAVLDAWRYGAALVRTGDDTVLRRLREAADDVLRPLHVRYWFETLADGVAEQWQKTTRDWPEPWLPWEGTVEEGEGMLIADERGPMPAHYSIWVRPAATPARAGDWGGAATLDSGLPLLFVGGPVTIRLRDGREGLALPRHTVGNSLTFQGQGDFPALTTGSRS